jgi:hypothetical protein
LYIVFIHPIQISDSQRPLISASFLGNGIMCGEIESVRRNRYVNVSVNRIV